MASDLVRLWYLANKVFLAKVQKEENVGTRPETSLTKESDLSIERPYTGCPGERKFCGWR